MPLYLVIPVFLSVPPPLLPPTLSPPPSFCLSDLRFIKILSFKCLLDFTVSYRIWTQYMAEIEHWAQDHCSLTPLLPDLVEGGYASSLCLSWWQHPSVVHFVRTKKLIHKMNSGRCLRWAFQMAFQYFLSPLSRRSTYAPRKEASFPCVPTV